MQWKVLLINGDEMRAAVQVQALKEEGFNAISVEHPGGDLPQLIVHQDPDVVIVDHEGAGGKILDLIQKIQSSIPKPLVMLSHDDKAEMIRDAVQAGACAYVVDGIQNKRMRPIVEAAIARFHRYKSLEDELKQAKGQLAQRKIIDQAKGILMKQRGCDEAEAYNLLRSQAMNKNCRIVEVAERLLEALKLIEGR